MQTVKYAAITILLFSVGLAHSEEEELGFSFDVTYMSKLMDKGFEYYGQQSGIIETLSIDLWGTGFGVETANRRANSSGYENKERFDYKVYYSDVIFESERYVTKYKAYWKYKHFPDQPRNIGNSQEWKVDFSWPEIFGCGLVPSYAVYYGYPAGSNYYNRLSTYWYHLFGLGYDWRTGALAKPLHLSANIAYRDGGSSSNHDWSHTTFGMSTAFELAERLVFVPGLYYQISMDDSVCEQDVIYCVLSMKYKF